MDDYGNELPCDERDVSVIEVDGVVFVYVNGSRSVNAYDNEVEHIVLAVKPDAKYEYFDYLPDDIHDNRWQDLNAFVAELERLENE